ncbi:MAG: hypothetical protein KDN19_07630 [Verrucomicrobiae bacterium]|nr:hypothetical protein [Verrucomicrobiae bacterium]
MHRSCFKLLRLAMTFVLFAALPLRAQEKKTDRPTVLVVVGAEGAEEYGEIFHEAAANWRKAASIGEANFREIGLEKDRIDDREQLEKALAELSGEKGSAPLWLVLIGHGTYDGRTSKFNVRGPDFTDADLADWLKKIERPVAVINTASASGAFIGTLSGKNRVVITATKSAFEVFYARFGEYFARAIGGLPEADVDNDDQVSLLEAFLYSADQVAKFYESEGRLASEHSMIDDNGDQLGTRPDWFEGVRAAKSAKEGSQPDGEFAHQWVLVPNALERQLSTEQKSRRDELELQLRDLVRKREKMGDDAYYAAIEPLLLEIARIYDSVTPESAAKAKVAPKKEGESAPVPAVKPGGESGS